MSYEAREVRPVGRSADVRQANTFRRVANSGNARRVPDALKEKWRYVPIRLALKNKRPDNMCIGNDNTCRSYKAKGTDFCVGHLRSVEAEAS